MIESDHSIWGGWRRRRRHPGQIEPTRLRGRDLLSESLAGLGQRPARTALTMVGTVLGVGAYVAVLGLTATATGQISGEFSVLRATEVTVKDMGADPVHKTVDSIPSNADQVIGRLAGVVAVGKTWQVSGGPLKVATGLGLSAVPVQLPVAAASPGYLEALGPTLASGTLYNAFHERREMRVAVLGAAAARQLGIISAAREPAVFIAGIPFTVVGILGDVDRAPSTLSSVLVPTRTARALFGDPVSFAPATLLIHTRLGAASLIARQAPLALRPDSPGILQAVPPPEPKTLQNSVLGSLDALFIVLAGITLLIGAVGIANTTLVAVIERTGEIGLRRALGATPRQIAAQFLTETAAIGTLGGLIGTALSVAVVVLVALARSWTALLDPWLTLPAPLIGTVTGLLAGSYPAIRAARVQPLAALRR